MLSRIHNKLGTAGLIVAVIALVAALAGTAIAATGLNGKQKKEVEKIAKKFAGKNGAPGATGPAGPQGPKGDTGAAGKDGTNGTAGTNGTDGKNGKGVITETEPTGTANCGGFGGSKFHTEGSATNSFACNGQTGFTETLPKGETETGSWGFWPKGAEIGMVPAPYNIPLTEAPELVVFNQPGTENCPGTITAPEAKEGVLCVYAEGAIYNETTEPEGSKFRGILSGLTKNFATGAVLTFEGQANAKVIWGTWAVTAK